MTRDAIIEANKILEDIKKAKEFWNYHKDRYEPDALVARINSTIDEYIEDMELKLDNLSGYFEYEKNKTEDDKI